MMGASAVVDPLTFKPVPNEGEMMGINDMLPDYDARGMGVLNAIGRTAQFQQMLLLMQVAQANPMLVQMVNWMTFWRQLLLMADVPNPDELMGTDGLVMQAVAGQLQQALGGGMAPSGQGASHGPNSNNVIPMPTVGGGMGG